MFENLNKNFMNEFNNEVEYLYKKVKKDIPDVSEWQLEQSAFFDIKQNKRVLFSIVRDNCNFKIGRKMVVTEENKKCVSEIKVLGNMLFYQTETLNDNEDYIKKSINLILDDNLIRKVCCFGCNDDFINLLIDKNKKTGEINYINVSNIEQDKLNDILQEFKNEICTLNDKNNVDITDLLEKIYFDNFYYEYSTETIHNKIREKSFEV